MKRILGFLILLLISRHPACAQSGVFMSPDDIEEISQPAEVAPFNFVYRVGGAEDSLRFYKVTMNNLLYSTKKTFQWPTEVQGALRYRLVLYATRDAAQKKELAPEILFNDRLVLANSDSLFFLNGSSAVPLRKIVPPGIVRITSAAGTFYQKLDAKGAVLERPLPTFCYTLSDTTQILFVKADSHLSQEIDPFTAQGQYRTLEVNLRTFPQLRMPVRPMVDMPTKVGNDTLGLQKLDSLIHVIRTWYSEDSNRVALITDSLWKQMSVGISRRKFETEAVYNSRLEVFLQEARIEFSHVVAWNHLDQALSTLQQKLSMMLVYRDELESNQKREKMQRTLDVRTELMAHQIWRRLFVSALWTVGGNMDSINANPGPSYLEGGGLRLDWSMPILGRTSLQTFAEGSFNRWRFQQSEPQFSKQESGILGVELGIPLGIAPAGNYTLDSTSGLVLQLSVGPSLAYRNTDLVKPSGSVSKSGVALGGAGSLNIYFASLPVVISIDYDYYSDSFGTLALRFGLPITHGGAK